jgi:hypothetical protein
MKHLKLFKPICVVLALLLLVAIMISPAAAQEPAEGEDGDVSIQMADFIDFEWNPESTAVSRGNGTVVTKLNINGAQQISGFTLAVAYDSSIVSPEDIRPGALLPGTRGVDYFMTVTTGGGGLICGDSSFTVNVVYFDPTVSINGSGSLFEVTWRSDPAAIVGEIADICLDGEESLMVDNGGVPTVTPVTDEFGEIEIEPNSLFKFQIGLEGGKNSGWSVDWTVPDPVFTEVTINGLYPCDGGEVDWDGFCSFNNASAVPPYTVEVSRIGYLDAVATFDGTSDSSSVFLVAGDLNEDNEVNILDIALMASLFGDVSDNTLSFAADYTGPGHEPDDRVDIMDLVLVARNYRASGPTDGTPPEGDFPF